MLYLQLPIQIIIIIIKEFINFLIKIVQKGPIYRRYNPFVIR